MKRLRIHPTRVVGYLLVLFSFHSTVFGSEDKELEDYRKDWNTSAPNVRVLVRQKKSNHMFGAGLFLGQVEIHGENRFIDTKGSFASDLAPGFYAHWTYQWTKEWSQKLAYQIQFLKWHTVAGKSIDPTHMPLTTLQYFFDYRFNPRYSAGATVGYGQAVFMRDSNILTTLFLTGPYVPFIGGQAEARLWNSHSWALQVGGLLHYLGAVSKSDYKVREGFRVGTDLKLSRKMPIGFLQSQLYYKKAWQGTNLGEQTQSDLGMLLQWVISFDVQ